MSRPLLEMTIGLVDYRQLLPTSGFLNRLDIKSSVQEPRRERVATDLMSR